MNQELNFYDYLTYLTGKKSAVLDTKMRASKALQELEKEIAAAKSEE